MRINVALAAGLVLYGARRDLSWHFVIVIWLLVTLFFESAARLQQAFLQRVGHVNSTLLLSLFYFLFLTPYGVLYRRCFRKPVFRQRPSTFEEKRSISSFDRPF